MEEERVVITGLGITSCLGNTVEEFGQALREGRSGIKKRPELEAHGFRCLIGGVPPSVEEVAAERFSEGDLMDMDSVNQYGCIAAWDAWVDAGLPVPERTDNEAVDYGSGAIIGSESAGLHLVADKLIPLMEKGKIKRLGGRYVEQTMASGVASRSAGFLALGNKVSSLNTASSTGAIAVADGFRHIRNGYAERMLCGASESSHPYAWAGVDALRVLACKFNDEPERASRPMSATACGFVPAAGAGVLLLESLKSAQERGARIYAEILSAAVNCGGQRNGGSLTAPNPDSVVRCIREAISEAGISRNQVDLINGHLTSTFADSLEIRVWAQIFGDTLRPIHATKSIMGHPMVAAGAMELVACCIMLRDGFIHPSLNCEDVHPEIAPYERSIIRETVETDLNIIVKSALGFGDTNSCLVLRKWP
jgi:3-oxoacyl-(acyl-carrier-protein) synthase